MADSADLPVPTPLDRAHDAVDECDWEAAAVEFEQAEAASALGPENLEMWATALYMLGRTQDAVDVYILFHQRLLEAGEFEGAVRASFWIAYLSLETGDVAQARGWVQRGSRLLDQLPDDSPAEVYLLVLRAYQLTAIDNDYANGAALADQVVERARAAGDRDVEALGLNVKGRALVRSGHLDSGMAVLDEAMVAVMSGHLLPVVVGSVYCSLVEACEEVSALQRAQEWTNSLSRWCDRQGGEVPFSAQCRIHRSKIHLRRGEMARAEEEARLAYELYSRTPYAAARGRALYQLAEVHRVRGDLDEAGARYHQASDLGIDPQPGLSLVHLARGDFDAARSGIERVLAEATDEVRRISLLPVCVEVMLAVDELDSAETAAEELAELASVYDTDFVRATAAQTSGMVSLMKEDAGLALRMLRRAATAWREMDLPYELARTRVLIGHGCQLLGDAESADLELKAASKLFQELGVVDVATAWLASNELSDHDLTPREVEVLEHLATGATNKEIADNLYLSAKTVDRHVANILTKLGVSSRTAAVAFGYEHDLL